MQVDYLTRQQKLIARLQQHNLQAMLIFGYENILYLTGFSGNAATLMINTDGAAVLITDYRYYERACAETQDVEVVLRDRDKESLPACLFRLLGEVKQICFEAHKLTHHEYLALCQACPASTSLQVAQHWVEQLRELKDDYEIASIKRAAAIADQALLETLPLLKAGITEREAALELEYRMQRLGSQGMSFATILLFGARSSLPHGSPGETKLKEGDMILLDFGAVVNGYRSDMTRSYVLGTPCKRQQAIFDTVQSAQQQALALLKPGCDCQQLNDAAHQVLSHSEFSEFAGEGLGHGLGLFLHETPFIKPGVNHQLQVGNVITIEPGIYIPNFGGVRLEEDVLITESGYQRLTHAPQQFQLG